MSRIDKHLQVDTAQNYVLFAHSLKRRPTEGDKKILYMKPCTQLRLLFFMKVKKNLLLSQQTILLPSCLSKGFSISKGKLWSVLHFSIFYLYKKKNMQTCFNVKPSIQDSKTGTAYLYRDFLENRNTKLSLDKTLFLLNCGDFLILFIVYKL